MENRKIAGLTPSLNRFRMIFDQTGSLANMSRHDYLPFGEELFAGVGGRTTGLGYTASDNVRQKFTQKERDSETGLDYFGARYYMSTQGRFVSPDAFEKDSYLDDPQSWNKYVYVRNNPLYFIDPSGQKAEVTVTTDEERKKRTITIKASFAVYAAKGQKVSQKQLEKQASLIKSQIEKTYTGSTTQNGYTYQISATVDVSVVADEKAAMNSGPTILSRLVIEIFSIWIMGPLYSQMPPLTMSQARVLIEWSAALRATLEGVTFMRTNLDTYLALVVRICCRAMLCLSFLHMDQH